MKMTIGTSLIWSRDNTNWIQLRNSFNETRTVEFTVSAPGKQIAYAIFITLKGVRVVSVAIS